MHYYCLRKETKSSEVSTGPVLRNHKSILGYRLTFHVCMLTSHWAPWHCCHGEFLTSQSKLCRHNCAIPPQSVRRCTNRPCKQSELWFLPAICSPPPAIPARLRLIAMETQLRLQGCCSSDRAEPADVSVRCKRRLWRGPLGMFLWLNSAEAALLPPTVTINTWVLIQLIQIKCSGYKISMSCQSTWHQYTHQHCHRLSPRLEKKATANLFFPGSDPLWLHPHLWLWSSEQLQTQQTCCLLSLHLSKTGFHQMLQLLFVK